MGITDRLERAAQPKDLGKLESEIALFEARKGRIDFKRGFYFGEHSSPEDQQPFMSHVLFAVTKQQSTSASAMMRGVPFRSVDTHVALGHLYHSFPEVEDPDQSVRPQPYRLKIPAERGFRLSEPLVTRMDLLTGSHLEGLGSVEDMCMRAIALGVQRCLEGIPETVQDPSAYLIEKVT